MGTIQAKASRDLSPHPASLETFSSEVAGPTAPDVAADTTADEAVLEGQDGGLDTSLLTGDVVQLTGHDGGRDQHFVDVGDILLLGAQPRRLNHLVRRRQRRVQVRDVGRQVRVQVL